MIVVFTNNSWNIIFSGQFMKIGLYYVMNSWFMIMGLNKIPNPSYGYRDSYWPTSQI